MSMIRSSVTISLVPEARGGPFVFWDDLENACLTAKELNFDAVEIFYAANYNSLDIYPVCFYNLSVLSDLQFYTNLALKI